MPGGSESGSEGDPAQTGDDAVTMGRQHLRGSAILVLGRFLAIVIGMVTQVILVRALTKTDFGAFAYALALAAGARILLSLGQGRLLSRFMATYEELRDYSRMFGAMILAALTIFVTSIAAIGLLYVFQDELIGSALKSEDAIALVLILIFLSPLEALDEVFLALFAVFSRPGAIFFRKHLVAPGFRLVVVSLLVILEADVAFVAVGYVLAALAGILMYFGLFIRLVQEQGLYQKMRSQGVVIPFRAVFSFSFPQITGELALLSMTAGGVIILGMYHSTVEIANYRAAFSSARLNIAITGSFITLFLPVIARLHVRGDMELLRRTYWHTASFVTVLSFPVFALTGPFAEQTTVTLFGDRYADSAPVLAILAVSYYISVMLGSNADMLQVCGRIRFLVGVNLFSAVLYLGLCLALTPRLAALGVAGAHGTTLIAQNLLNQSVLRRTIRTSIVGRECRGSYAAVAGGALALWCFSLLFSPGMLISMAAIALVSVLVLAASRQALQLKDTFPELGRVPLVGRLIR